MQQQKTVGGFMVLPPPKDKCQICAVDHHPSQPHNKDSLFYQFSFCNNPVNEGRSPTWEDAMAHCTDEVKQKWTELLAGHGIIVNLKK